MNGLVSEFFYEGIRRIIPGLVIVILYWHKEVENVFITHHDSFSPILFSPCILVIVWFIGLVFESITYYSIAILLKQLKEKFPYPFESLLKFLLKFCEKLLPSQDKKPDVFGETNGEIKKNELLLIELRRRYFADAEKVMCRSLFLICFFACFHSPEAFSNFLLHPYYYVIGGIAFLIEWIIHQLKGYRLK